MHKNTYVIDLEANKIRELERLQDQGRVLTSEIQPLLPPGFNEQDGEVIDLGCGAGEWALKVGLKHPGLHIRGLDRNVEAVKYANAQSHIRQRDNVEFIEGDITKPFPFPKNSVDLVNARFLAGINDRDQWPRFVSQCYDIVKPGGWVCLTEPEVMIVTGVPAYDRLARIGSSLFYDLGKSFSQMSIGVGPKLKKFLQNAGFVDVQRQIVAIDFSYGTLIHRKMVQDLMEAFQLMRGLFLKYMSEDEYDRTCEEMEQQFFTPGNDNDWYVVRAWGRKPA